MFVLISEAGQNAFQGLNLILRLIGDEQIASEPLVSLESLAGDAATNLTVSPDMKPPVFLVPGMEGMATVFENLAKKLEFPTICLQFPYDSAANESMQAVANFMLPVR